MARGGWEYPPIKTLNMKIAIVVGVTVAAVVAHECWPISLIIIGLCIKIAISDLKKSGWFNRASRP